ncbi:PQQ-dependent sugar dehydrogenase [Actinotalea subterranea]|uniref:PQQ-dependent sugar dehydrogenase n=1 Tax=Actinotalea subterranea TaxID=2607497 RepID=UPI001FE72FAE|nr:PQQ-dependent sugar dehydrogenase [Actinotalea subterranea]
MSSRVARGAGRAGRAPAVAALLVLTLAACADAGPPTAPSASAQTTGSGATGPDEPAPATSAPPARLPVGEPVDVTTGLTTPWSVAFLDGTPLVSERDTGRVLEVLDDGTVREVGVVDGVVARGEGGLLGLAVDERGRLFSYSTGADGNRILRHDLTGSAGALALGAAEVVVEGLPSAGNHNGGRIAFGPDGMLYAGTGDAGVPGDAQDVGSLAGKILRMTPDGEVPADNPVAGSLVFSWGHRNVQGLAWADDGTMLASELGQDTWDELNVVVAGGNYGWPVVEGMAGDARFVDPVQQWPPSSASPSGIAVVGGTVYVANLRGQVLRAVPTVDLGTATDLYAGRYGRLRDVTLAPDGTLWFVTQNTDGRAAPKAGDDRVLRVPLEP